ncbi:MAG: O-antigen ligase family protein [Peptococcaceae bacterium]|jgi:O-antigen ligase|nr:O-antigen ligase family protein [Peptococcaceae bacterium]
MAKISAKGGVPGVSAGKAGTAARQNKGRVLAAPAAPVRTVAAQESFTHRLAFWGVLGILFVPAFFSGMFFPPAQEKGLIVAAVVFWLTWVWKYFNRDTAFLGQPLDYFALAMPVAAVVTGIGAANYSLAVNEVVKYILYFMVFWVVARLVTNENEVHKILHAVYLSALGVALAGLGSATGIVNVLDGFTGGRIYSTFQYPNATASYLAAALILGLYLWHRARQYRMPREIPGLAKFNAYYPYQFVYAVANFLLAAALVGTDSYGGFLTFAVAVVLYFLLLPGDNRTAFAYQLVTVVIVGALAARLFLHEVAAKHMGPAWLVILAGAVLVVLCQLGWLFLERRRAGRRTVKPGLVSRRILAGLGILVVLAVAAVAVWQVLLLFRHPALLTQQPYAKLRMRDVIERLYFYFDALVMFTHRPILGWGGGGWQAAYRSYQSFLYNSNQGHSYYLQVLVEMGAVGILIVIGLWYSFLRLAHRLFRAAGKNPARRLLIATVTMVAVEVGTHALVDFDLALSALFLVIWAMFGLAWALDRMDRGAAAKKERKKSYVPYNHAALLGTTAFSIVAVLLGLTLAASNAYAQQAAALYGGLRNQSKSQARYDEYRVLTDLQRASRYNPLNPAVTGVPGNSVDGALATLDLYQGQAAAGVALAQKGVTLDPYDAQSYATLANLESNDHQAAAAVSAAQKAVALAPFQQQWYDDLAQMQVTAGIQAISGTKKNTRQARGYFEDTLKIPDSLTARMNSLNAVEKKLWNVGPPLRPSGMVNLATGISNYFLGNYAQAARQLTAAQGDSTLKDEAMLWQSVLDQKTGQTRQGAALLAQVKKDNASLAAGYNTLIGLSLADNAKPAAKPAK